MAIQQHYIDNINELDRFKTEIDFIAFLQRKGYTVDQKITSNTTTGLVNETTGSKIFIKTLQNGHQIYSDKKAPLDTGNTKGGTIIDWVQKYENVSNLGEVRKILRQELNIGIPSVQYSQIKNAVKKEIPAVSQEYFKFGPLINRKYLNSRGISNETLDSPAFLGRIGEKKIQSVSKPDSIYSSTVFPMYEKLSEKIVGLEVKNEFYSGSFPGSSKSTSFWKSNPPRSVEKPTAMIVEAPIDALSHYQLKNKGNHQGIIYYGTNGEIGGDSDRIKILNEYFSKRDNKFSAFKLGTDNDVAGVRFNINIIGNVNVKESDLNIKIIAEADQHYARITVISDDKNKLEKFSQDANIINNKLPLTTDQNMQYRNFQITSTQDGKYKLQFLMNNRKEILLPLEQLAIKHRNSPFQIERAIEKDFCKDLEKSLGIERTEVVYGKNDKGHPLSYSVWKKEDPVKDAFKDFGRER